MRRLLLWVFLGLGGLGLVLATPSPAPARFWRGGWRGGWYGGWRPGFYARPWWGRPYVYPGWGWGGYYPYPAYYNPYPAYAYPSYLDAYPFDGMTVPPVSAVTTSPSGNPSSGSAAPSAEETALSKALTASGVANDNGRLRWPVGLQILGGPETAQQADELRRQLGVLFQEAAGQAAKGPAGPKVLKDITRAVARLRDLLTQDQEERGLLPETVYDEAQRFLNQLEDAKAVLSAGLKTQADKSR